jgi:hypothetical protein
MNEELTQLLHTLNHRCGFEAVNHTLTDNQVRISARVAKEGMPNWLLVMDALIDANETAEWNADLSKQYFKRNGRLIYCWRIIFQGAGISQQLPAITSAIQKAPRAARIVDEQPLAGASASRNTLRRGKGAQNPLSARVGPASWGK